MPTLVPSRHTSSPVRGTPRASLHRAVGLVGVLALAGSAATGSYTVRSGDTLSEIASRHGITSRALATANGISDPHRVQAGRVLAVPGSTPAAASSYTVRSGDTLSEIASRNGTTTAALAAANGISDRDRIAVGRTLSLPPVSAPAAARSGATAPQRTGGARGYPARLAQSSQRLAYIPIFERWAATYGVPADLLMAMTWLESGWQRSAVSSTGAVGIGQIMPDTTTWMREIVIREPLDPRDPEDNIRMSARYLRWLLDRTGGDVRLALGGYYQGLRSVQTRGLLAETERYVVDILAFRDRHF